LSRPSCIVAALFVITAGAGLAGCSTTLATRPPRNVDLGGEWQIDLALSDFPQEAVPVQDAVTGPTNSSGGSGGGQSGGGGPGGGRGGRGRGMGMGGGMPQGGSQRPGGPEHHFAMPPHLSITQSATGVVVNITMPDGKHAINTYTSGEKSVVSTTRGDADRTLGWDGKDYVIRTKVGEKGPQSEVRYTLDDDGTLSVTSTITNSGVYNFQYTLEYDRVRP
jgi:hypothetical protein